MKRSGLAFLMVGFGVVVQRAAPDLRLPAFPRPALVEEGGRAKEVTIVRLQRDLFREGVHPTDEFETLDSEYGLLRNDSVGQFAAWLETVCQGFGLNLLQMRNGAYDATTFSRLLEMAASLGALQEKNPRQLAIPIGLLVCKRNAEWGALKRDGALDAYILFATDAGILVYDPPTRQLANLADFPNKAGILRIRF